MKVVKILLDTSAKVKCPKYEEAEETHRQTFGVDEDDAG